MQLPIGSCEEWMPSVIVVENDWDDKHAGIFGEGATHDSSPRRLLGSLKCHAQGTPGLARHSLSWTSCIGRRNTAVSSLLYKGLEWCAGWYMVRLEDAAGWGEWSEEGWDELGSNISLHFSTCPSTQNLINSGSPELRFQVLRNMISLRPSAEWMAGLLLVKLRLWLGLDCDGVG